MKLGRIWSGSLRAVVQQGPSLDLQTASNSGDIIERDIALGPFDPAEVSAVDSALMGQPLLTKTTLRPQATHIPRQHVPKRPFVSLFHKADFGSITLLRRPL